MRVDGGMVVGEGLDIYPDVSNQEPVLASFVHEISHAFCWLYLETYHCDTSPA